MEVAYFAIVKMNDFPLQLNNKLVELLKVELTTLMVLKHPIILETLEKVSCVFLFY